jgi:hypothetical protein
MKPINTIIAIILFITNICIFSCVEWNNKPEEVVIFYNSNKEIVGIVVSRFFEEDVKRLVRLEYEDSSRYEIQYYENEWVNIEIELCTNEEVSIFKRKNKKLLYSKLQEYNMNKENLFILFQFMYNHNLLAIDKRLGENVIQIQFNGFRSLLYKRSDGKIVLENFDGEKLIHIEDGYYYYYFPDPAGWLF